MGDCGRVRCLWVCSGKLVPDGELEQRYGVCAIMSVEHEKQRTIKRAEIWALLMASSRLGRGGGSSRDFL